MTQEEAAKRKYVTSIELDVLADGDPEVTCARCNLRGCEYLIHVPGDGRHTWWGLHGRCLAGFRLKEASAFARAEKAEADLQQWRDRARTWKLLAKSYYIFQRSLSLCIKTRVEKFL